MSIKFSCTSFAGTGKKGILTPDENGYYFMPIGGLNVFNSAGMYYTYSGAKELFENSSQLMRRVKRGALRGEVGHPVQMPGESMDDFINRYISIDDKNVCCHFAEISLDFDNYKNPDGQPIVAIMAKVCPSGVHGDMLKKQFNNPKENVCFSIRSFTHDYMDKGIVKRDLKNIITFDNVNEPGISHAEKFKSTAIESLYEKRVSREQVVRALEAPKGITAMESSAMNATELFKSLGWSLPKGEKPIFSKW